MAEIIRDEGKLKVTSQVASYEQLAATALDTIADDRATLAGSPTNAEVIAILDRILVRESKLIKTVLKLIRIVSRLV